MGSTFLGIWNMKNKAQKALQQTLVTQSAKAEHAHNVSFTHLTKYTDHKSLFDDQQLDRTDLIMCL